MFIEPPKVVVGFPKKKEGYYGPTLVDLEDDEKEYFEYLSQKYLYEENDVHYFFELSIPEFNEFATNTVLEDKYGNVIQYPEF